MIESELKQAGVLTKESLSRRRASAEQLIQNTVTRRKKCADKANQILALLYNE